MSDLTDAEQFENRNEALRNAIDVLASYDRKTLEQHGEKTRIANEHDIPTWRIHYVLKRWDNLVSYRREANLDPMDPDVVEKAYDDDTLQALARGEPVADGLGNATVNVSFSLDKAFRAIKLLPSDLGADIFRQIIEQSADLPNSGLDALFTDDT